MKIFIAKYRRAALLGQSIFRREKNGYKAARDKVKILMSERS